ncbi:unnamed protein product [Lathyrus oleraceus]
MEWQKVSKRGNRGRGELFLSWDFYPGGERMQGGSQDCISSIYFLEFSDHCRAKDIFDRFKKHGDISEVVIPHKRNNLERRFGFARFREVEDVRMLAVRRDNIFIDNY